jgi:hypothetical protein
MKLIPPGLSRALAQAGLKAGKNAPALLFGAGVTGMVGSTVLACRATLRLEDTIETVEEQLEAANTSVGKDLKDGTKYTERDRKQDVAKIYIRGAGRLVRLYGPSILLGAASIACLTKSHNILQQRNIALAAAYAAVDGAFKQYRERVVSRYGEDVDREMRYSTEEVQVIDEKTGKMATELRVAPDAPSMYARFFDEFSTQWDRNPEYNLLWLRNTQNYWNDVLRTRGHVFLNEVYKSLGLDHTTPGSVVGWIYGRGGDDYIDFGVFDSDSMSARNFMNGRDASVLLDFNCDGVIYDKIGQHQEMKPWQAS